MKDVDPPERSRSTPETMNLPMTSHADLARDLDFVKELARECAEIAIARRGRVLPSEKANLSFVTDLDTDLERLIRGRLKQRFPDDQITGEEYDSEGGDGPRRWSIDPIDGTGNLVHGLPLWAVSIGLIDDGQPVLGVIAIPPLGELYWATHGSGAWRDGERLHALDADFIHDQDNICVGTNALRAVDPRSLKGRLRDLGSACCEQAFVASNRLQASILLGEHAHDVAAGVVLATEAGCHYAAITGERLSPAEVVRSTPISRPVLLAPPQRLEILLGMARQYSS